MLTFFIFFTFMNPIWEQEIYIYIVDLCRLCIYCRFIFGILLHIYESPMRLSMRLSTFSTFINPMCDINYRRFIEDQYFIHT